MRVLCGTDIIEVGRVKKALESSARFAKKVYTDAEIEYCENKKAGRYESYAARFAAKEAFLKAVGAGLLNGAAATDAEIVNDPATGAPAFALHGDAARLFTQNNGVSIAVSLSHTRENALATVVIICEK